MTFHPEDEPLGFLALKYEPIIIIDPLGSGFAAGVAISDLGESHLTRSLALQADERGALVIFPDQAQAMEVARRHVDAMDQP